MTRALVAAFVALALAVPAAAGPPRQADLEAEVVCPTCKVTLDQSSSPIAIRMKAYIRTRIAAGDSAAEIKQKLVAQFGPGVLAEPPKHGFDLLAWALPLAVLGAGAVVVGLLAWTWSRRRRPEDDPGAKPLDPDLERRVDEELAGFEP